MKLDREKLLELASRCEAATGPDRELDAEIFLAVAWPDWKLQTDCDHFPEEVRTGRIQEPLGCGWRSSPTYTASLDAAMTLVPDLGEIDGKRFDLHNFEKHCIARVYSDEDTDHKARADTPALALTAAALRALAGETE